MAFQQRGGDRTASKWELNTHNGRQGTALSPVMFPASPAISRKSHLYRGFGTGPLVKNYKVHQSKAVPEVEWERAPVLEAAKHAGLP